MGLPPLHALSIDAFAPKATTLSTDEDRKYFELSRWKSPFPDWRMHMFRALIRRAQAEGEEFRNASGVVFDEAMLYDQAGRVHPFAPVTCTPEAYRSFEIADYFHGAGGAELYTKHLEESGVGALFQILADGKPHVPVRSALARATPQPQRFKLLFELLDGKVTAPESRLRPAVLEQVLHAVSGMRAPSFVNPEANNKEGNATNDGFEYHELLSERDVFRDNGAITRSFFSDPAIKECCIGSSGGEFPFQFGQPRGAYLDNDYKSMDAVRIEDGEQATFVTVNTMPTSAPSCSCEEMEGRMFFNRGQVYTSMSPRWTFEPEGYDRHTDDGLVTYALRVDGPVTLRCTIQEPRSNYVDMVLLSSTEDGDDKGAVNVTTALLPVVILPARMAFKIDRIATPPNDGKKVVFATYIPYSKDDPENFPKRAAAPPPEEEVVVLSD